MPKNALFCNRMLRFLYTKILTYDLISKIYIYFLYINL